MLAFRTHLRYQSPDIGLTSLHLLLQTTATPVHFLLMELISKQIPKEKKDYTFDWSKCLKKTNTRIVYWEITRYVAQFFVDWSKSDAQEFQNCQEHCIRVCKQFVLKESLINIDKKHNDKCSL